MKAEAFRLICPQKSFMWRGFVYTNEKIWQVCDRDVVGDNFIINFLEAELVKYTEFQQAGTACTNHHISTFCE